MSFLRKQESRVIAPEAGPQARGISFLFWRDFLLFWTAASRQCSTGFRPLTAGCFLRLQWFEKPKRDGQWQKWS